MVWIPGAASCLVSLPSSLSHEVYSQYRQSPHNGLWDPLSSSSPWIPQASCLSRPFPHSAQAMPASLLFRFRALSHLRAFVLAVPSLWNCLSPNIPWFTPVPLRLSQTTLFRNTSPSPFLVLLLSTALITSNTLSVLLIDFLFSLH